MKRITWRRMVDLPEVNFSIVSFLLNFLWEMWQVPFFKGLPDLPHWVGIKACTCASVGDTVITIAAFWVVAAVVRSRAWILHPRWRDIVGFTLLGIVTTVVIERESTGPLGRWAYADHMPTLPVLGIGLLPLLQWAVLPPLVLWIVKRQLAHRYVTLPRDKNVMS